MKLNKYVMTAALSVGFAGLASAQVNHVYITGSTAFRAAAFNAISNNFDSSPTIACWSESSFIPANLIAQQTAKYMLFSNTVSTVPTIVKCFWTGSEAGISDLTANKTEAFPTDAALTGNISTGGAAPDTNDISRVDIAMADNSQAVSKSKTPALTSSCQAGVVPFLWCKNNQTNGANTPPADWSAINNLSTAQAKIALSGGIKMAQLIGDETSTKFCYVAGRNDNSGTRANAYLSCGLATGFDSTQILIAKNGANVATNSAGLESLLTPYPSGTPNRGGNGQDSGGTLATSMTIPGSSTTTDGVNGGTGWYAVAYLGIPDFASAQLGGAVSLTFNGVPFSVGNCEAGTYTFWNYEYSYLNNADLGGAPQNPAGNPFFTSLCNKWAGAVNAGYEIALTSMNCKKNTDASDPVHN
jgi:hypothetical protein